MINSLGILVSGLFCGVMRIRGSGSGSGSELWVVLKVQGLWFKV